MDKHGSRRNDDQDPCIKQLLEKKKQKKTYDVRCSL